MPNYINVPAIEKHTSMENINEDSIQNLTVLPWNAVTNLINVNEAVTYVLTKIDDLAEHFKTMSVEYKIITEHQQAFFEKQNNIVLKLKEMQTHIKNIKKSVTSPNQNQSPDVKPVGNLKELEALENLLSYPDYKEKLKQQIQIVCSKGKKMGINNAYALIDVLFSRGFLNQCSWAGGSRSGESKICFKSFTKTIDFFFNILHESDPDFSKPEMQKFFLTVLKNSRQRLQSKQIRRSTRKNRISKKRLKSPLASSCLL